MAWINLLIAGFLEVTWAILLKKNADFSNHLMTAAILICTLSSFFFLSLAMKQIPLGTAYTVWTCIGAVGTVIFGIIWLNEPKDIIRLGCIALILAGVIGLKLTS